MPPALSPRDRLIAALDMGSADEARALAERLGDAVSFYKIGYRLGFAGGLGVAQELVRAGKRVFLDFKLHDIGNTVEEGTASVSALGASLLTVHAYPQTMAAAVRGRAEGLRLLAVTVLTSYDEADVRAAGYAEPLERLVESRARAAAEAGIDGIVCAALEAERVRAVIGPDRLIVTPGIRPAGADAGDQKRVVTPAEALRRGADHIVVGRPITHAADPRDAAARIVDEMAGV